MDWIGEGFEDLIMQMEHFASITLFTNKNCWAIGQIQEKNAAVLWLIYMTAYDGMLMCRLIMQPFTSTRSSNAQTDRKRTGTTGRRHKAEPEPG